MSEQPDPLKRLASTLTECFPGLLAHRRIDPRAPRVQTSAAEAERVFEPFIAALEELGPDERSSFYRKFYSGHVTELPIAEVPSTVPTSVADHGDDSVRQPIVFGSTDTDFKRNVNTTAFLSMQQLGRVYHRLLHAKAKCTDCSATPGVLDTCRVVFGELLCYTCDRTRHEISPCARCRYVLSSVDGSSRPVLISLHPNDFIIPDIGGDIAEATGNNDVGMVNIVAARDWIQRRGA